MLITDATSLSRFSTPQRRWQGIPSIERTKNGRIFAAFYSGSDSEYLGNYCLVVKSDDDGHSFTEPIAVTYDGEDRRTYDPCLWIDPTGRLWLFWGTMPAGLIHYTVCDDPDADTLVWSPVQALDYGLMLNKPTVLKNGDWLLPVSVWDPSFDLRSLGCALEQHAPTGAHVLRSRDNGKTFERIATVVAPERSFDEHMLLEKNDGTLEMYLRVPYGIGKSESDDGGYSWTPVHDSGIPGPTTRFHIRRLRSGRVIMINHHNFTGRSHLTALLSEDDGKTFPHTLLLDGRKNVSYPDLIEAEDGTLYVIYDHERGAVYSKNKNYENDAREILMAKFTEADVLAGALVSPESRLAVTVSALGYRPANADFLKTRIN